MEVRAISTFRTILALAWFRLVYQRMIFKFFPPVTLIAFLSERTAILIVQNEVSRFPMRTRDWIIIRYLRLSSVILPVVGINTECFVVLSKIERTPGSLEMEHVKVVIVLVIMN